MQHYTNRRGRAPARHAASTRSWPIAPRALIVAIGLVIAAAIALSGSAMAQRLRAPRAHGRDRPDTAKIRKEVICMALAIKVLVALALALFAGNAL